MSDRKFVGISPESHEKLQIISEHDNRPYKNEVEHLIEKRYRRIRYDLEHGPEEYERPQRKQPDENQQDNEGENNILDTLRG